jgi:ribosomal protein L7/L12
LFNRGAKDAPFALSSEEEMIKGKLLEDARVLIEAGADREMILLFFRDNGMNKIDSIKSVRLLYKMSMAEAKELVHRSNTWADCFHRDEELHETARRALQDLAASNDPNLPKIVLIEPEDPKT